MPITFTCECGETISVPDGMEGRVALCGRCRKTMKIPGRPPEEGDASSVSGLFREALAEFGEAPPTGEGDRPAAGSGGAPPPSEADTRVMAGAGAKGSPEPPADGPGAAAEGPPAALEIALDDAIDGAPDGAPDKDREGPEAGAGAPPAKRGKTEVFRAPAGAASTDRPVVPDAEELVLEELILEEEEYGPAPGPDASEDAHATGEVRAPAPPTEPIPQTRDGKVPGPNAAAEPTSAPAKPPPKTQDALAPEYAAKVLKQRELDRAIRREGEPDSPAGAYEPREVELHGHVMKFHCRCGKRISVAVDVGKTIGRCPQCAARIVVPKPSQAKLPIPEPEPESKADAGRKPAAKPSPGKAPKGGAKARAENVRRATAEAADRLRKRGPKAKTASPAARREPVRASGPARLFAAAADAGVLAAVLVGSFYVLGGGTWEAGSVIPTAILGGAAWCANRIVVQWVFGSSIGMMAAGVRLARLDGRPLSFGMNAVRAFAGVLLVPLAPAAVWDKGRRTLADRAAGTVVLSDRSER